MTSPEEMLDDIQAANGVMGGITLSDWEENFVADMEDRLAAGRELTEGQLEALDKIWNRI